MRVLMLAESYAPIVGGVQRMVEGLGAELVARGHRVAVATLRQPSSAPAPGSGDVAVHTLFSSVHRAPQLSADEERRHAPPLPDPEVVLGLRRLLRRERPDVVHAHDWLATSYLPLARRSGAAFVLSLHDYGLLCATRRFLHRGAACTGPGRLKCMRCAADYYGAARGPAVAAALRLTSPRLRRSVDAFLPVSPAVEELCGLAYDERSRVVPNFVADLPPFPGASDDRLAGLPGTPFVLYCGDVTLDKGAACLIEAYGDLEDAPPLALIGRNFLREPLPPGATALGPLPHELAIEAVRRSLFTVVPSVLPETFGLAALESAAAGRPVVASRIGGLTGIVRDGETGLLVPPGDRAALREAMARLLADKRLRARMGEAALRRAADFSAARVVPLVEDVYRRAVEARQGRRAAG